MKTYLQNHLKPACTFALTFLKWLALALGMGIVCGIVGTAFHFAIHYATDLFQSHSWLLYLLPLFGILIVFLYQQQNMEHHSDTNAILNSIHSPEKVSIRLAPLIFIGTTLTHLGGGSAGREGAALQIGGSIGTYISQKLKLPPRDRSVLIMCGMSAVFSALFSTPVTAAVFCMEVISVGIIHYSALVPCLFSAIIANYLASFLGVTPSYLGIPLSAEFSLVIAGKVLILSAVCALVSILFCVTIHKGGSLYKRLFPNPYFRILAGGILVILLTLLVGNRDFNNSGMDLVASALSGRTGSWDFLLKILFTAVTLGAGFKGGEIVPSFAVGATLGCALSPLLGITPQLGAAVGLLSLFCGVVNCPLATILLGIELFGSGNLLLYCLAISVSYMLSGYYGLYSAQRIVYSKLEPHFIDKPTK